MPRITLVISHIYYLRMLHSIALQDKVKAARDLLAKVRRQKPSLVKGVEQLCDSYIDLAYHDVTAFKAQRGPLKLPTSCPLLKVKDVAIPTSEVPVDRSCCYKDVLTINRFDTFFQLAGGVNLPKVVTCVGSDGKRKKQLVKVWRHFLCGLSPWSLPCAI